MSERRIPPIAAGLVSLWVSAVVAMPAQPAQIAVEPGALHFGTVVNAATATRTPPQTVILETAPGDAVSWQGAASASWLEIQPASGTAPGAIRVSVRSERLPPGAGLLDGIITLTTPTASLEIPITVSVSGEGRAPLGAVDVPADHVRSAPGPIRFSGWALDDVAVTKIEIRRDPALLATAVPYTGARPDVAATYARLPSAGRSGWTTVLDTSGWPRQQHGTFRVQVVAHDGEGRATVIGTRSLTVDPEAAPRREWPVVRLAALAALALGSVMVHVLLRRQFRRRSVLDSSLPAADVSISPIEWLAIAAITVLAGSLTLPTAGGLGYDELYTYTHFVGRLPPWIMASALGVGVFNNHVAYSWLASLTVWMLGAGDLPMRLPAAVLGTLSVPAVWYFTRTFAPRSAALLAALLLALSPMHVAWSHAARGYTGLALMTLVSSWAFFRLIERPSRAAALVHAAATAAAIYFHLYGIWVAGTQYMIFALLALFGRISHQSFRGLWQSFLGAGLSVAALYGPVLVLLIDIMGGTAARARTAVQPTFPIELFAAVSGTTSAWTGGAAALLLVAGLVRLRHRVLQASYLVLLLCVPLLAVWLLFRPADLYPRFFHFWTPAACMLMAVAVTGGSERWMPARRAGSIAAGLLLIVTIAGWIPQASVPDADNGYRSALTKVREEAGRTRTLLFGPDADLLRYYLAAAPPIVDSAGQIDHMMRDDPSPLLVLEHKPGWQSAEHARMEGLLSRRCAAVQEGSVVVYRCALAGRP